MNKTTRKLLKLALAEDIGRGDITSNLLIPQSARGKAVILAKQSGIFCGEEVVREIFRLADPRLKVKCFVQDGRRFSRGKNVFLLKGNLRLILKAERTALNFLAHLSGIATLTRACVDRVKKYKVAILDTRKTTPLWRELEKYAVRCGGGVNHRRGLWDEILVKDTHWAAMNNAGADLVSALSKGRPRGASLHQRKFPVEIEVKNLKELANLITAVTPDRILLDNFSVKELKRAVIFVQNHYLRRGAPTLEASGGVTLENVAKIAATGVDRISIGRLTHSAPAIDFSLGLA